MEFTADEIAALKAKLFEAKRARFKDREEENHSLDEIWNLLNRVDSQVSQPVRQYRMVPRSGW